MTRATRWVGGIVVASLIATSGWAQTSRGRLPARRASGAEAIVRVKGSLVLDANRYDGAEPLVPSLGILLVRGRAGISVETMLADLRSRENVLYAHRDHPVTPRAHRRQSLPNDPDFAKQWPLNPALGTAHISAVDAWRLGTGGQTRMGDEIVVAVVDSGVDVRHPDLEGNLWMNTHEIAGNGVDDDGNGYVDDVYGWDAIRDTGTISPSFHATHVSGIIGARGGNARQVAGINWQVKIMAVTGSSGRTSVVLKAYNYVLEQKKRWLETKGRAGANVVVTNSSFGVDYAKCTSRDFAAWNDIYDAMGAVGILSAAATANLNVDVDQAGDVPTTCPSAYLIAVTNTNSRDERYAEAAYGRLNVDLGAPGTDVLSLGLNGSTRLATGTSMATPQVAGAVALLHSVASPAFAASYRQDPALGALAMKEILLKTVDPITALQGITVTGGRLNVGRAAETIAREPGFRSRRRY